MRVLRLSAKATPAEWGRTHGEMFAKEIRELVDLRMEISLDRGLFQSADQALKVAKFHLPVLLQFDRGIHAELMGIATGSGCLPSEILLLNHYNDLWMIDPENPEKAHAGRQEFAEREVRDHSGIPQPQATGLAPDAGPIELGPPEEDCSSVMVRTPEGACLAQTWDAHATVQPYTMMLHCPSENTDDPYGVKGAWLFSVTGCLGLMGLNDAGVAVGTNSMVAKKGRIGVIWPALIRKVLQERTAKAGRDIMLNVPTGAGRHFLLADRSLAYGVETTSGLRRVVFGGPGRRYGHTNHALAAELQDEILVSPDSSSRQRYDYLFDQTKNFPVRNAVDLWERMGSHDGMPGSICHHLPTDENPHTVVTCGGMLALMDQRKLWIAEGCLNGTQPTVYDFEEDGAKSDG